MISWCLWALACSLYYSAAQYIGYCSIAGRPLPHQHLLYTQPYGIMHCMYMVFSHSSEFDQHSLPWQGFADVTAACKFLYWLTSMLMQHIMNNTV